MPDSEFLEKYPLYRKFDVELPRKLSDVEKPAIHMFCPVCKSEQTFNAVRGPYATSGYSDPDPEGQVAWVVYRCAACGEFNRVFLLKFGSDGAYVMKVGQEPPWSISVDRNLEKILGDQAEYYRRGLICESQGYGIGAFSYYRRIVEEIIDGLLAEITGLVADEDRERYAEALERAKSTTIAQDKIDLVKDLLPPILRPNGMNPLSTLHRILSEGLHQETDERCIELAMTIREVLVFLVNQVTATKASSSRFTESMRKLLDRRRGAAYR